MGDREVGMIGRLAALVAAVLDGDQVSAGAYAGDVCLWVTGAAGSPDAVEAGLLAALRFDPVGIAEIAEMAGESKQNANHLMGLPGAPAAVQLSRGKVWRAAEVRAFLTALGDRSAGGRQLKDGEEYIPAGEVEAGMAIVAGMVTGKRYSESGKSVYLTVRDAGGEVRELHPRAAAGTITVFPGGAS
jgi:hypothetical protein